MIGTGVVARVRACTPARRLVPTGLALLGTDIFYRWAVRLSPHRAEAAYTSVAAVVGGTSREAEAARLAPLHAAAIARGWELTWRPWELARIPIHGLERLEAARAAGRGVIVSHAHLGPLAGWVPMVRMLRPMLFPQGDWILEGSRPSYNGYQTAHWRKLYRDAGAQMMHHVGSAPLAYRTLSRGGSVLISMDVPGDHRTEFLGKTVDLDDGTARLAVKAGALILPAALMPVGRRWEIDVQPAMDPQDFAGPDELHVALTRVHERLIMQAPQHLEGPGRLWARISPEGWYAR